MNNIMGHSNEWGAVIFWFVLHALVLFFLPFYGKRGLKLQCIYLSFVMASALEKFGIPFSMYFTARFFGINLPEGLFWGNYIGVLFKIIGIIIIISGWTRVHLNFWKKDIGYGKLVQSGIYGYIRHPQYTGIFFITIGMMLELLTLPQLIIWPILLLMYIRTAGLEEREMELEFGVEYLVYKDEAGMFFPRL